LLVFSLEKVLYLGKPQDRTFRSPLPAPRSPLSRNLVFDLNVRAA
jgi:hypothetical protein